MFVSVFLEAGGINMTEAEMNQVEERIKLI